MDQQEYLVCSKAYKNGIFIDYKGRLIVKHVVDRSFDVKKFFLHLKKARNMSWKEIFYKIYSFTFLFNCLSCNQYFNGPFI